MNTVINQSVKQSFNLFINQSIHLSTDQSIYGLINQSFILIINLSDPFKIASIQLEVFELSINYCITVSQCLKSHHHHGEIQVFIHPKSTHFLVTIHPRTRITSLCIFVEGERKSESDVESTSTPGITGDDKKYKREAKEEEEEEKAAEMEWEKEMKKVVAYPLKTGSRRGQ